MHSRYNRILFFPAGPSPGRRVANDLGSRRYHQSSSSHSTATTLTQSYTHVLLARPLSHVQGRLRPGWIAATQTTSAFAIWPKKKNAADILVLTSLGTGSQGAQIPQVEDATTRPGVARGATDSAMLQGSASQGDNMRQGGLGCRMEDWVQSSSLEVSFRCTRTAWHEPEGPPRSR